MTSQRAVSVSLVLIVVVVVAGFAWCGRAEATPSGELEPEKPCVSEDVMAARLANIVREVGGLGGIIRLQKAQAFSDEAHRRMDKSLTTVSVILFWYRGAVAVAELDGGGCLALMYPMPGATFHEIIKTMPASNPPSN